MVKEEHFETPGQVLVRVDNKAGPVELHTHDRATTEITLSGVGEGGEDLVARTRVHQSSIDDWERIEVDVPSRGGMWRSWRRGGPDVSVAVQVPEGAAIEITTEAGDLTARGRYGEARLNSASGQIDLERTDAELRVRSGSGPVHIGAVAGEATIHTASGDVDCDQLDGGGEIKTASGDVTVHAAGRPLTVYTASGDVSAGDLADDCLLKSASGDQRIKRLRAGQARLDTVSGEISVGIARGTVVALDAETVSGTLTSEIDFEADEPASSDGDQVTRLRLRARTVSGDLRIDRANP